MFAKLRTKFNLIGVREESRRINVQGILVPTLFRDIDNQWNTTVVTKYVFEQVRRNSFSIPHFFAPDLIYMLNVLVESPDTRSAKRVLIKLIKELENNTWLGNINSNRAASITDVRLAKGVFPFTSKDYQDNYIIHYGKVVPTYGLKGYMLDAGAGTGKAQPLYSPILTPEGWSTMGDMYVGKEIKTPSGRVAEVSAVWPQGLKDIYQITFEDGRTTEACLEHLWEVIDSAGNRSVMDTGDILASMEFESYGVPMLQDSFRSSEERDEIILKIGCALQWSSEKVDKYFVDGVLHIPYCEVPNELDIDEFLELLYSLNCKVFPTDKGYDVHTEHDERLAIVSIDFMGRELAQCISIDDPDCLYITDNYIVTHNTATGLMLGKALRANKTIVISPLSAVDRVWRHTIEDLMLEDNTAWMSNSGTEPNPDDNYFIVHFEYLANFLQFVKNNKSKFQNTYVILDESHNFNDIDSQRTTALVELCGLSEISYVNFASATPIMALGYECIPFLRCVDPMFTQDIEARFKKIYGRSAKRANDILRNRIGHLKYHVPKQDVVDVEIVNVSEKVVIPNGKEYTLPAVRDKMKQFMDARWKYYESNRAKYQKDYDDALKHFEQTDRLNAEGPDYKTYKEYIKMISAGFDAYTMGEESKFCNNFEKRIIIPTLPGPMKHSFRSAKSVVKYLDLKIMGEALGSVVGKARSACNRDIVDNLDLAALVDKAEKKTIFFTDHVEVLEHTGKRLIELGYKPALVYGETNRELSQTIKKFYTDPDLNPLIATFKSLSTAVPITCANHVVFLNEPFREATREQALSRAARLGQDTRVIVTGVTLDTGPIPNMSTRSKDIMEWSGEQVRSIMGTNNLDLETLSLESSLGDLVDASPEVECPDYLPSDMLPVESYSSDTRDAKANKYFTFTDDLLYEKYLSLNAHITGPRELTYDPATRMATLHGEELSVAEINRIANINFRIRYVTEPSIDSQYRLIDSEVEGVATYTVDSMPDNIVLTITGAEIFRDLGLDW